MSKSKVNPKCTTCSGKGTVNGITCSCTRVFGKKTPFGTGKPCVVCGKREGSTINCGACNSPRCVLTRMRECM